MKFRLNLSEMVNTDFKPIEESEEGELRGGFGEIYYEQENVSGIPTNQACNFCPNAPGTGINVGCNYCNPTPTPSSTPTPTPTPSVP